MDIKTTKTLNLPAWIKTIDLNDHQLTDDTAKMEFVCDLALQNIEQATGGPFAAAVIDAATGKVISIGVNIVETANTSIAHAEMVSIMLAQAYYDHYRLDAPNLELVSSAQPCAMCYGAVFWSGIKRVLYGADKQDVQEIVGFDEGPLPQNWTGEMAQRDITIEQIVTPKARKVLQAYKDKQGLVY